MRNDLPHEDILTEKGCQKFLHSIVMSKINEYHKIIITFIKCCERSGAVDPERLNKIRETDMSLLQLLKQSSCMMTIVT